MSDGHRDGAALPDALEEEVLQALELDDPARNETLAALMQREPTHATAIRRWLASSGVIIDATVVAPAGGSAGARDPSDDDETCDPPRRIGRYRIVRLLGRGGFGSVHLAEHDGMTGQVAVKVLNPGMDSREVLRRFAAEREALLRMDHPGIARLIDAGETAAGRPYFVMEFVAGDPLLVHCRRHALDLPQRLHLFLKVLDAVAHAHQKGVIHRDLSGNNVLVAGDGGQAQPKIIDFGVAKSLREPLLDDGALTFQGTLMGTPEYMSPEQAQGQIGAIDTRTDVYSLGVHLYELLADQLPIPGVVLRAQGVAGMAQVIRTHVPPRPSQVAPRHLQAALRGDLDWIAQKAIAKDRDERYASAAEFGNDLRRHLAHQPVIASPPSTWYVMRKFARRHWPQVTAATTGLLLLVGALLFSLEQWRATRTARTELQRVHDDLAGKAAEGFGLLASQQRLRAAEAAVPTLDPPWPERIPQLRQWLATYGEPLRALLPQLLRQRDELAARKATSPDRRFLDPVDEDLLQALVQMSGDLQRFSANDGTVASVQRRLQWSEQVVAPALQRDASIWADMAAMLRRDRGFQLAPQPGLVPLGKNPDTQLFEFLDLGSHPRGAPMPTRDAQGQLKIGPRTGIVFALAPSGTVRLGALRGEPGLQQNDPMAGDDELRGRTAMLTEFFVARTELTRSQWSLLIDEPIDDGPPDLPATDIDWDTARQALRRFGMSLPTEAQWEYACRAGTSTPWWRGSRVEDAREVGNFGRVLQPVARLAANAFGLFDVHGNAAEWCADWKDAYAVTTPRNGDGLLLLQPPIRLPGLRSVRGGSALSSPEQARTAARSGLAPHARDAFVGCRPVRAVRN